MFLATLGVLTTRLSFGLDSFDRKRVILTIDDGPRKTTNDILDLLGEDSNPVIFYFVGKNLKFSQGMENAKRAVIEGHIVGNHSYNHTLFSDISFDKAKDEINRTEDLISEIYEGVGIPRPRKFFRYPYGGETKKVNEYLEENNFVKHFWDVDSNDWRYYSKNRPLGFESIMKNVRNLKNGDIVLLHDLQITAQKIIPYFIDSKEYQLVLPHQLSTL